MKRSFIAGVVVVIALGCGTRRSTQLQPPSAAPPSAATVTAMASASATTTAALTATAETPPSEVEEDAAAPLADNSDPMRQYGHVFHGWEDLPSEVRSQIPSLAFKNHMVVRIDFTLGCIDRDRAKRPLKGYAWPSMAQRCIEGKDKSHPVVSLTRSSLFEMKGWVPLNPTTISATTQMSVSIDATEVTVGLGPLIEKCDGIWLVDSHWLLLPKRTVRLSLAPGSGVCWTL